MTDTNLKEKSETANWPKGVKVFVEHATPVDGGYSVAFCQNGSQDQEAFIEVFIDHTSLIEYTKTWAKDGLTDICDHTGNHLEKTMVFAEIDKNAENLLSDYSQIIVADYIEEGNQYKLITQ